MDGVHVSLLSSIAKNNNSSCELAALDFHRHTHLILTMALDRTIVSLFFYEKI